MSKTPYCKMCSKYHFERSTFYDVDSRETVYFCSDNHKNEYLNKKRDPNYKTSQDKFMDEKNEKRENEKAERHRKLKDIEDYYKKNPDGDYNNQISNSSKRFEGEELARQRENDAYEQNLKNENERREKEDKELNDKFKQIEEETLLERVKIRTINNLDGTRYVGQMDEGSFQGKGTMYWSEGHKYTGTWRYSCKHGTGIMKWKNEYYYDGYWFDDKMHGQGIFKSYITNTKFTGTWENGFRLGFFKIQYGNEHPKFPNATYEGYYDEVKGGHHGNGRLSYPDGIIFKGKFDSGKIGNAYNECKVVFDASKFVKIGKEFFTPSNLQKKYYTTGEAIFYAKSKAEWVDACENNIPAWAYPEFKIKTENNYDDIIYNYYVDINLVSDVGLSSSLHNWSINQLIDSIKINKLNLISEEFGGNNSFGFNARPTNSILFENDFKHLKSDFMIWTTIKINNQRNYFKFNFESGKCEILKAGNYDGFPIRLIKVNDEE